MKDLKEKLKGTCVLNEKEGMGAEIVKLYMAAGFENPYKRLGKNRGVYAQGEVMRTVKTDNIEKLNSDGQYQVTFKEVK